MSTVYRGGMIGSVELGSRPESPRFSEVVERAAVLASGPAALDTNVADTAAVPERVAAVRELVDLAGDDRGLLERAQRPYLDRIQRDSGDLPATGALSLLVAATAHSDWRMDRGGRRDFGWSRSRA